LEDGRTKRTIFTVCGWRTLPPLEPVYYIRPKLLTFSVLVFKGYREWSGDKKDYCKTLVSLLFSLFIKSPAEIGV